MVIWIFVLRKVCMLTLEVAIASNSAVIITDNKQGLVTNELHFDFEVLTAKEFLERMRV